MSDWTSIDEIFDFAIKNEEEAAAFYRELVTKSSSAQIRTIFESFARELRSRGGRPQGQAAPGQGRR